MLINKRNQTLYRLAFISSPIMALYGLSPIYIFVHINVKDFMQGVLLLTFVSLKIWVINITILSIFSHQKRWRWYMTSYLLTIILVLITFYLSSKLLFIKQYSSQQPNIEFLYPLISGIAINTIILIIINGYIINKEKLQAQEENRQLRISQLETENKLLLQQLQPHFLFNALSTLKSLIRTNVSEAQDYILKLSGFLRFSFNARKNPLVTVDEELIFVHNYISLYQARFPEALRFDIVDLEQVKHKYIPVFAIQGAIENAIKHNAFTPKKKLHISISLESDHLRITNNKIYKAEVENSGIGLKNLNQRYKIIGGSSVEIQEDKTHFTLCLNLIDHA